ncbi:carbohydrate deacetylase [Acidobacteriota bacterium]
MKKKLIINADDFGRNPYASEAILNLAESGRITSTTILANFVSPGDLEALRNISGLSTGYHLNVLEGTPLTPADLIPSLVDDEGNFFTQKQFLTRFYTHRISRTELETEIRSQIQHLLDSGITISHADSHKHLHQHPVVGPFTLQIFKEMGIRRVRRCRISQSQSLRMKVVGHFDHHTKKHLGPFVTPDILISYFSCGEEFTVATFLSAVRSAFQDYSTAEVMCHPSTEDSPDTYLHGKNEYKFLLEEYWKDRLESDGITLINYNQLD